MADELSQGDKVEWETLAATGDDPQYVVHSDKTGAEAAHKPSALTSKS